MASPNIYAAVTQNSLELPFDFVYFLMTENMRYMCLQQGYLPLKQNLPHYFYDANPTTECYKYRYHALINERQFFHSYQIRLE